MVVGLAQYSAEYKGLAYKMAGKEELDLFLEEPWRFAGQKLPAKLPPARKVDGAPIPDLASLPHTGYCEVYLGQLLVAALAEAGELRPWLPSLTPRDTALKYIGLYLKVRCTAREHTSSCGHPCRSRSCFLHVLRSPSAALCPCLPALALAVFRTGAQ